MTRETKPENPPAFPHSFEWTNHPKWSESAGVSLRDYFAAKAMQGLLAVYAHPASIGIPEAKDTAQRAYAFADAMLKERSKS